MAAKNKTTETDVDVIEFVNDYANNEQKKVDSFLLIELMKKWSGCEPKMWGPTIVGFGNYHYKYASGHENDAPLIAFSPRKPEFSLYVTVPGADNSDILRDFGKFKMTKGCIYVKRLEDINIPTLKKLCERALKYHADNFKASEKK